MMRYKLLGRSGLRVSELALGTMTFGEIWGWGSSKEESHKVFDTYVEAGGNFIDTANRYTDGTSEKYVGEFISADRDHFVLATKYTLFDRQNDPNFSGNQRKNMVRSLEGSLKRLNTDFIDLFWVHAWDFTTPVEEVMRGLDDLVRAGKVLYIGISDAPAWVVSQANTMAELRGWTRFTAMQLRYSLLDRGIEREHFPLAHNQDMAITAWGALGSGVLSGKYNESQKTVTGRASRWGDIEERSLTIAAEVINIAAEIGCKPSQVALNWVRQQPGIILPIIGARTEEQIKDNLACLDFSLDAGQLARLNQISHINLGFPYNFLSSDEVKAQMFGKTFDQVDNHRVG